MHAGSAPRRPKLSADVGAIDPMHVPARGFGEGDDAAKMIAFVEEAEAGGGMAVLLFHGVGGDHLAVTDAQHRAFIAWLKVHRRELWVTTLQQAWIGPRGRRGGQVSVLVAALLLSASTPQPPPGRSSPSPRAHFAEPRSRTAGCCSAASPLPRRRPGHGAGVHPRCDGRGGASAMPDSAPSCPQLDEGWNRANAAGARRTAFIWRWGRQICLRPGRYRSWCGSTGAATVRAGRGHDHLLARQRGIVLVSIQYRSVRSASWRIPP